jgi:preprotein translocase subunit SecG
VFGQKGGFFDDRKFSTFCQLTFMKRINFAMIGLACLLGLCLVIFSQDKEQNKTIQPTKARQPIATTLLAHFVN